MPSGMRWCRAVICYMATLPHFLRSENAISVHFCPLCGEGMEGRRLTDRESRSFPSRASRSTSSCRAGGAAGHANQVSPGSSCSFRVSFLGDFRQLLASERARLPHAKGRGGGGRVRPTERFSPDAQSSPSFPPVQSVIKCSSHSRKGAQSPQALPRHLSVSQSWMSALALQNSAWML